MSGRPNQARWDFEDFPSYDAHSQEYWRTAGKALHRLVREAVQASPDKQGHGFAEDVGANRTQFTESLRDDGVKRFADEWLPRVIVADRDNRILRFLCRLKKMEPKPLPILTPEQKLRRIIQRLEAAGAPGHAYVVETFGDEAEDVVRACQGDGTP